MPFQTRPVNAAKSLTDRVAKELSQFSRAITGGIRFMHEAEMLWKHAVGVSKDRKASWRKSWP